MKKQIIVDYKIPWLYPHAGIAGAFNPLLEGVMKRFDDVEFLLVAPGHLPTSCPQGGNCRQFLLGNRASFSRFGYFWYSLLAFPAYAAEQRADLLLSPYYDFRVPVRYRGRAVITVHDLCILDMPATYPFWTRWLHSCLLRLNLPRAAAVMTVSQFSRSRLLDHFPQYFRTMPPQVIYNSFLPRAMKHRMEGAAAVFRVRFGIEQGERVILYSGGVDQRKNINGLLAGFGELLSTNEALLVITGNIDKGLKSQVDAAGLGTRVIFTGPLDEGDMAILCGEIADCGISVSLYEGFGRSAVEAKLYGLPFVSAPLPAIREMVGDYPVYCDPDDPDSIAYALRQALDSPREGASNMTDARFSLEENCDRLAAILEGLLAS